MDRASSLYGCLLGIAVGDSLGLPFEGLSDRRVQRRLGSHGLRQSLVFGRGMLSDDTEQSCLILESAARAKGSGEFQRIFSRKLRAWFLALPAGVGLATVKACLRLLVGVPPGKSGVSSAGNGAAMRAPILGVLFSEDPTQRRAYVDASSVVTHSDQRAIDGARVMAEATALCHRGLPPADLLDRLAAVCESPEWIRMVGRMKESIGSLTPQQFAREIGGLGKVTGYVLQSVPVAIFTWLSDPRDAQKGLETVIRLGGDTDTTGAMLGALYGASLGSDAFPDSWTQRIADYPRSVEYLRRLSEGKAPRLFWPLLLARNVVFLGIVLAHGFRRLVP